MDSHVEKGHTESDNDQRQNSPDGIEMTERQSQTQYKERRSNKCPSIVNEMRFFLLSWRSLLNQNRRLDYSYYLAWQLKGEKDKSVIAFAFLTKAM